MTGPAASWRSAAVMLAPAVLLFAAVVITPLVMTLLLSFNSFSMATGLQTTYSLKNYAEIFGDPYFAIIFLRTLRIAFLVTVLSILIGVPEAYIIRRMTPGWRSVSLLVVIGPLLISVVARTLGWALILGNNGLISLALQSTGLSSRPVSLMFTETGVVIAMVHVLVPFLILSVWATLARIDPATEKAALSLGASQFTVFRRIMLPQMMPGILSGGIIVFSLAASAFATPAIVGGRRLKVAATLAYDEFLNTLNWPLGAAVAVLLLVAIVTVVVCCNRIVENRYRQVFQ